MTRYTVTIATEPDDLEQIHALNYRTFVEEIPQHHPNPERRLVDRFHAENTYVVCKAGDAVVGMVCVRDRRPFSVDKKIGPFEAHLPPDVPVPVRPCEIRLLAIDPAHRGARVILGLLSHLLSLGLERGHDFALMSGRPANMTLYRGLGLPTLRATHRNDGGAIPADVRDGRAVRDGSGAGASRRRRAGGADAGPGGEVEQAMSANTTNPQLAVSPHLL